MKTDPYRLLLTALADGPRPWTELLKRGAKAGISEAALRTAGHWLRCDMWPAWKRGPLLVGLPASASNDETAIAASPRDQAAFIRWTCAATGRRPNLDDLGRELIISRVRTDAITEALCIVVAGTPAVGTVYFDPGAGVLLIWNSSARIRRWHVATMQGQRRIGELIGLLRRLGLTVAQYSMALPEERVPARRRR